MKILVTPTSIQNEKENPDLEHLEAFADEIVYNTSGRPITEEELLQVLPDCDGYLAGVDQITARVLRACPKLKAISRYGVGYENVDLKAARSCGILVSNTPGANSEAVGELAFSMMMALARKLVFLDADTKQNGWTRSVGMELYGKTLGILGLGNIGKVVARCATGFEMRVIAYDPYIDKAYCKDHGIEALSLKTVVSQADFLTLHLPLNASTKHMVDSGMIAQMKDGVILINVSRGGLINEAAAFEALKSGKIGGLGLDTFEEEPPVDSALFQCENVIATPHTGAHTKEATINMIHMAVDNLLEMLTGRECRNLINRDGLNR